MGKGFAKVNACSHGSFEGNADKIPQWIRFQGGQYSRTVSEDVTHLITTPDAYEKNVGMVKEAKQFKHIKIVSYDWLEDSLLSKTRTPKPVKPYLLENRAPKAERKKKVSSLKAKKKAVASKGKGPAKARAAPKTRARKTRVTRSKAKHRVYTDEKDGITYAATLHRQLFGKNARKKFVAMIYESIKKPHTYTTFVKYSRIGVSKPEHITPLGSELDPSLASFKSFFKDKTGKEWEERANGVTPDPRTDEEGKQLPAHNGWYHYDDSIGVFTGILEKETKNDI